MSDEIERSYPKTVCIGGGTGLSTMLRGLKLYTPDITAIVTMADDGGGSGVLREELGMLPPGDVRNCITALANIEPAMAKLMTYRFDKGHLKGQSFGNLFLAAMYGICGSFEEAVTRMGDVLAITGKVLPVTTEDVRLYAEFENGAAVLGESKILAVKKLSNCRIRRVKLVPEHPKAQPQSIEAINEADLILIGPGSLYTSIIPALLADGIADAVKNSPAVKLYIANVMTQDGETEGYTVSDHVKSLFDHCGGRIFDKCLTNNKVLPEEALEKYKEEDAEQIFADMDELKRLGMTVYERPVAGIYDGYIRHNPRLLAKEIMGIYADISKEKGAEML